MSLQEQTPWGDHLDPLCGFRIIELTKGEVALVDEEDYPLLSQESWHIYISPRGRKYARNTAKEYMHRRILGNPKGQPSKHKNGNGLDNRKCNIRPVNDRAKDHITVGLDLLNQGDDPAKLKLKARVLSKVVLTTNGCWSWAAATDKHGYGQISINRSTQLAHRVSYGLFRGSIPEGLVLDHLCRNPICVNPEHLEPVAARENTRRAFSGSALSISTLEKVAS